MNREKALIVAYAVIALSGAKYKEIPAKARWIAQDANGSWWWYARKPTLRSAGPETEWAPLGGASNNPGGYGSLSTGAKPKDFTKEIYKL